jgi:hypothetical protein
MTEMTIVARKPFHEAIVEMLKQASSAELETLGHLLMITKIPKGHSEIIAAWSVRCSEMGWSGSSIDRLVIDLTRHKWDIEAQAGGKTEGTSITQAIGEKGIAQVDVTSDCEAGGVLRL